MRPLIALIALIAFAAPAMSQANQGPPAGIVAALTQETVEIRSDFAGAELVLYGATQGLRLSDDIVVAVRGPASDLRVMRKQRTFGIWINRNPVIAPDVPGYYAVASTRPLNEIAPEPALAENALGLLNAAGRISPDGLSADALQLAEDAYREAIARVRERSGLFAEEPRGVEVLDGGLFRATVILPPETPVGDYQADVYLFRDGVPVASRATTLRVEKAGIERVVFDFAHDWPWLYGLWAVILAVLAGWGAAWVFNRD